MHQPNWASLRMCDMKLPVLPPPSLDQWLAVDRLAQIVSEIVNQMDIEPFRTTCKIAEGGYLASILERRSRSRYTAPIMVSSALGG
jgi:hypothetical protein